MNFIDKYIINKYKAHHNFIINIILLLKFYRTKKGDVLYYVYNNNVYFLYDTTSNSMFVNRELIFEPLFTIYKLKEKKIYLLLFKFIKRYFKINISNIEYYNTNILNDLYYHTYIHINNI